MLQVYDTLIIPGSHQAIEGHVFQFGGVVLRTDLPIGSLLVTGHAVGAGWDITIDLRWV